MLIFSFGETSLGSKETVEKGLKSLASIAKGLHFTLQVSDGFVDGFGQDEQSIACIQGDFSQLAGRRCGGCDGGHIHRYASMLFSKRWSTTLAWVLCTTQEANQPLR